MPCPRSSTPISTFVKAKQGGRSCGAQFIADTLGTQARTVMTHARHLADIGWIEIEPNPLQARRPYPKYEFRVVHNPARKRVNPAATTAAAELTQFAEPRPTRAARPPREVSATLWLTRQVAPRWRSQRGRGPAMSALPTVRPVPRRARYALCLPGMNKVSVMKVTRRVEKEGILRVVMVISPRRPQVLWVSVPTGSYRSS